MPTLYWKNWSVLLKFRPSANLDLFVAFGGVSVQVQCLPKHHLMHVDECPEQPHTLVTELHRRTSIIKNKHACTRDKGKTRPVDGGVKRLSQPIDARARYGKTRKAPRSTWKRFVPKRLDFLDQLPTSCRWWTPCPGKSVYSVSGCLTKYPETSFHMGTLVTTIVASCY